MAVDLVSAPFTEAGPPPLKRRRLGWDVPDPALLAEAARLQLLIATQLSQACPSLFSTQSKQTVCGSGLSSVQEGLSDSEIEGVHGRDVASAPSPPWHEDDKDGHFNFDVGENLTSRYKIIKKMGEGTFGRVLECWDKDAHEVVAIKVVRSADSYREAAMIEIDVLRTLAEKDRMGSRRCVQMKRWFDYRNHICIVFEKLGPSLYDFLRANDYRPFSLDLVRDFGHQLLESLAYMHSLNLIHTDLKPENVLLVSSEHVKAVDRKNNSKHLLQMKRVPKTNKIKLIDFGSTTFDRECSFSVVSTRHYRAPEVILGSGWSYPCDIWSVACILVELCSGKVLFQTHENLEHLAMMEQVLGPIPPRVIRRAMGKAHKYFRHERRLDWPDRYTSREGVRAVHRLPRLRDLVTEHVDKSVGLFVDLLERMLSYDPSDRPTAKEALRHPFFLSSSLR